MNFLSQEDKFYDKLSNSQEEWNLSSLTFKIVTKNVDKGVVRVSVSFTLFISLSLS